MTRLLPHPVLTALLTVMWMVLTRFSPGHLLLGLAVGALAAQAMAALLPAGVRIRRWDLIPALAGRLAVDILRSNVDVARAILTNRPRRPALVEVPRRLRDRNGLAILAIAIAATPGTAWIEYRAKSGLLVIHAFDGKEEGHWRRLIQTRYEALLLEIFE